MELERLSGVPQSVANTAANQATAQAHNNKDAVVEKTFVEKYITPYQTPLIVGGVLVGVCIIAVLIKQNSNTKELEGLAGVGAEKKTYKKRKRK